MSGAAKEPSREVGVGQLAASDGREGRRAWVAHAGSVYDVSGSVRWQGGTHMGRHPAGADLTAEIGAAPHGPELLERVPRVGALATGAQSALPVPPAIARLVERFPLLRRHPHPMTVHFPIVFLLSAGTFSVLSRLTGDPAFEQSGFFCLAGGLIFTPIAILFGFLTWRLNYGARPLRAVRIKTRLSYALLGLAAALFAWRSSQPALARSPGLGSSLYLLGLLALMPIVAVIGWFGASLVFPLESAPRRDLRP